MNKEEIILTCKILFSLSALGLLCGVQAEKNHKNEGVDLPEHFELKMDLMLLVAGISSIMAILVELSG